MMNNPKWKPNAPVPSIVGPTPGECIVYVRSVQNIDPPSQYGGANFIVGLSYTVDADTPNGPLFGEVGVVPKTPRHPHPWIVVPLEVTTTDEQGNTKPVYPGTIINGKVYLLQSEDRYAAPCEGGV